MKKVIVMNPLTSLLLIANPIVTAVLTLVVFLESKKQKNMLETVEKAILNSSRNLIEAVEKQKGGFDSIAASLKGISEDQTRSVETFTGISNALTVASSTNQQSMNNVINALNTATLKNEETFTNFSQKIDTSNNELKANLKNAYNEAASTINQVGTKLGEEYQKMSERITDSETKILNAFENTITSQQNLNASLVQSISNDTKTLNDAIKGNSVELSEVSSTLKNAVSI